MAHCFVALDWHPVDFGTHNGHAKLEVEVELLSFDRFDLVVD